MATPDDSMKIEHVLAVDEFSKSSSVDELNALARLIQTIAIMEKGTNPSIPDMGVGIKNYQFEFLDEQTLGEVKSALKVQVDRFVANNNVEDIVVQKLKSQNGATNTLGIMVKLSDGQRLVVLFTQSQTTSKVVSKIVV